MASMERNGKLIEGRFYKYLLPGIMMVAAMQLGNLVDSIFVGNLLGPDALSAINLGTPIVQVAQFPIMLLAVGGSIVSAICLGKRELKQASAIFSLCIFGVLIFNIVNAVASCFYSYSLGELLANGNNLSLMTGDFIWVYIAGMPFIGLGLMMSYFLSIDNHPSESAALHISANVINLVADYVLIAWAGMGMKGSALSTVIGYGVAGFVFTLWYLRSPKRTLALSPSLMAEGLSNIGNACRNGLASAMWLLLSCLKMLVLNAAILAFTGETGMALYAVCINSFFLVQLGLHGVTGVIQSVSGVLYGEKDYFGIRVVLNKAFRLCLIIAAGLTAIFIVCPGAIEAMFGFNIVDQKDQMDLCLRVFALSFFGYALNNIAQTYYSTTEKQLYATLNTLLQGLIILVPITLILLPATGIVGTSIGSVVAEAGAFAVMTIVRKARQNSGKEEGRAFAALPDRQNECFVDITVGNDLHDAAQVARVLKEYCLDEGIAPKASNHVAMAGEELVREIAAQSKEKFSYIDVFLVREKDSLVLRVRDDGPLLNPLESPINEPDHSDEDISEIEIIKRLATRLDYSRVLNMNNTIVEISAKMDSGDNPADRTH